VRLRACRNATHALGSSGSQSGSIQRGRGGVHGGARASMVRGIEPLDRGGSGGEVTARSVVGGVLTKHASIIGNGDVQGVGEVALGSLCGVGSG
jgi:hypothetical protein